MCRCPLSCSTKIDRNQPCISWKPRRTILKSVNHVQVRMRYYLHVALLPVCIHGWIKRTSLGHVYKKQPSWCELYVLWFIMYFPDTFHLTSWLVLLNFYCHKLQTASYKVTSDEELRLAIKRKLEKPMMIKFIGKLHCTGLGKNPSTTYQFSVDIYWISTAAGASGRNCVWLVIILSTWHKMSQVYTLVKHLHDRYLYSQTYTILPMCKILSPHLMTATLSSVIYTLCIARARLESVYENKSSEGGDMPSKTPSRSTLPIAWVAFKDISWLKTGDLGLFTPLIPFHLTSQWTIYSALSLSANMMQPFKWHNTHNNSNIGWAY